MENRTQKTEAVRISKRLIDELIACALTCENCASMCLHENEVGMMTRCIELNRDCSDICFQGAHFLMRGSEVSSDFLSSCIEICRLCSQECKKHEAQHCQACAQTCEECVEACEQHRRGSQVVMA
jgi:hypothetical protein